jgi:hypothetical protein
MELTFKEYKLRSQLFVGAVAEIIGFEKANQLMQEAHADMLKIQANERQDNKH